MDVFETNRKQAAPGRRRRRQTLRPMVVASGEQIFANQIRNDSYGMHLANDTPQSQLVFIGLPVPRTYGPVPTNHLFLKQK
jgi:hypothetical protein